MGQRALSKPLHPCRIKVSLADTMELSALGWGVLRLGFQLLLCPSLTRLSQGLDWIWDGSRWICQGNGSSARVQPPCSFSVFPSSLPLPPQQPFPEGRGILEVIYTLVRIKPACSVFPGAWLPAGNAITPYF